MQQQTGRCGRSHRVGNFKKRTEEHLCELVGLGIGHDEEDECGYEGVLGLEHHIEHYLFGG